MKTLAAAAALLLAAAPGHAGVVLWDNFDAANAGVGQLNYTGFANFNVTGGAVDLIATGDFGITCLGGTGSCVDLDGTVGAAGGLETKNSYAFAAGDLVSLTIQISGNQRGGDDDDFSFGFNVSPNTLFKNVIVTGSFAPGPVPVGDLGPGGFLGSGRPTGRGLLGSAEPFETYGISFVAGNAGSLTAFVNTGGTDNVGPIVDNFALSIGGAVPEPASWALMIAGFGLVGTAARRRRVAVA